ncbi:hypothetical protein HK101_012066 [Irineochytrium annulatum]|nr:hypothetical protein HK101_012066 [Irineochytrium annulatum]
MHRPSSGRPSFPLRSDARLILTHNPLHRRLLCAPVNARQSLWTASARSSHSVRNAIGALSSTGQHPHRLALMIIGRRGAVQSRGARGVKGPVEVMLAIVRNSVEDGERGGWGSGAIRWLCAAVNAAMELRGVEADDLVLAGMRALGSQQGRGIPHQLRERTVGIGVGAADDQEIAGMWRRILGGDSGDEKGSVVESEARDHGGQTSFRELMGVSTSTQQAATQRPLERDSVVFVAHDARPIPVVRGSGTPNTSAIAGNSDAASRRPSFVLLLNEVVAIANASVSRPTLETRGRHLRLALLFDTIDKGTPPWEDERILDFGGEGWWRVITDPPNASDTLTAPGRAGDERMALDVEGMRIRRGLPSREMMVERCTANEVRLLDAHMEMEVLRRRVAKRLVDELPR